mmetsp:Transcript_19630/g.45711  ORF Transcript_19630/g.45711 Transcript_19630/m.45711 type:complete len:307 (+) Transcript_19630:183-1103(+)
MEHGHLTGPGLVRFSRQLTWVLRHGGQRCGVQPDEDGWVKVIDLLKCRYFANKSEDALVAAIKASNQNKRRYALQYSPGGVVQVRASRRVDNDSWDTRSSRHNMSEEDWHYYEAPTPPGQDALQSLLRKMRESRDAASLNTAFPERSSPKDYDSAIIECIPLRGASSPQALAQVLSSKNTRKEQVIEDAGTTKVAELEVDCSAWSSQRKPPSDRELVSLSKSVLTGCGFSLEELGAARLSESRCVCFIEVAVSPPTETENTKESQAVAHVGTTCKAAARTAEADALPWGVKVDANTIIRRLIPTMA